MEPFDWTWVSQIAPDDLPDRITTYLAAHQTRDLDTAIAQYTPDAVVTDEGHDHDGPSAIRAWLARSATEYTYTTTLTAAYRADQHHFDVLHRLQGNFPGGVADLHYRFTLRDGHIARLVIEP
ncbi:nuclear transport factor 2 family protein [Amycolatopsis panacis]|uniref:Nuclear transport factor 2 family protein n=1 Tax=Amycolatopsis panacis TaxID=2340917 RepID=A0A419I274_9PSEU|nr:nuclear transport factor 2 family protein [Amycolatopsis panacis]RJQ83959.1 nuclear transport factor 2 family protein [Amycolatopsis panacis]